MKKIALIILILLVVKGITFAQSLEEYLQIAAENNSEVKAYRNDYLAAMEKVPQVGSLPDAELNVGVFITPMERFMGNQVADIQLMQMFPWFGMLRTQKDEAGKMALAQYEVFQDAKNRLFFQVKNTWYELYRLEQEIRITAENLEILRKYERLALIRFQSAGTGGGSTSTQGNAPMQEDTRKSSGMGGMEGGISIGSTSSDMSNKRGTGSMGSSGSMNASGSGMSNVLRVRMEVKELETTLAFLTDSRVPLQAEFNQLLNRGIAESIEVADTLTDTALPLERLALLDSIKKNNPMLKMLEAENTAYESQKRMAKLEGRPMLGVGINYMPFNPRTEDGMSMGGKDMVMPMVRLTIPIYRKKYNALQKEAELRQLAVEQRRENTINQLSTQWATAMRDLDDASRKTRLYKEQTGLASQTLNLVMTSYTTEGRDFEEVLRVQQQLLDFQLKLINAIVDQHVNVALLESLASTEF